MISSVPPVKWACKCPLHVILIFYCQLHIINAFIQDIYIRCPRFIPLSSGNQIRETFRQDKRHTRVIYRIWHILYPCSTIVSYCEGLREQNLLSWYHEHYTQKVGQCNTPTQPPIVFGKLTHDNSAVCAANQGPMKSKRQTIQAELLGDACSNST